MLSAEQRDAQSKKNKAQGFQKFLADRLVRMSMATMPAGEHQEVLRTLLEAAFEMMFRKPRS